MIHHGDCLDVMTAMAPESVDAICTDPPYGLEFMGKEWDRLWHAPKDEGRTFTNASGHMWDNTKALPRLEAGAAAQAWHSRWAEAAYRVAKPSAYLLAFGGTRTVHRMTVALEDAGWIIRDMLVWAYASGFPKSKASLKPAWEPIVMARKPGPLRELAIDACRIGRVDGDRTEYGRGRTLPHANVTAALGAFEEVTPYEPDPAGRWPANVLLTATEWYTLRDDVDQSARDLIRAYFEAQGVGVDGLSGVRDDVRNHPSVGTRRSTQVLLPSMQLEGLAPGEADGNEASTRVDPADEGRGDGSVFGGELASLEGRALVRPARVRMGGDLDASGPSERTSRGDGSEVREGPALHPGAPVGDGDDARPTAGAVRGSASPQWGEGRQQPEQPVPAGPVEPHSGASNGRSRTGTTSGTGRRARSREHGVTVPRDLIPVGWLQYFRFSHDTGIFDGGWEGVVGGGETGPMPGTYRHADGDWQPTSYAGTPPGAMHNGFGDSGTYSRFFLVPKADRAEREPGVRGTLELGPPPASARSKPAEGRQLPLGRPRENAHPTVKPVDLMRHLVRLVTPPGGTVLDCFLGSGTTGIAAEMEGFPWIGIEREAEYVAIAEARLQGVQRGMGLVG